VVFSIGNTIGYPWKMMTIGYHWIWGYPRKVLEISVLPMRDFSEIFFMGFIADIAMLGIDGT
jgi:hypothetical protein